MFLTKLENYIFIEMRLSSFVLQVETNTINLQRKTFFNLQKKTLGF